ncbi:hypothetical protein [Vibrio atypicus]|uniref:hypothetical protein n=1 Tax=Vibrio atypicus TaxID=558271 RepID=UPI00135ABB21|nr:hypothetical protein [Vibrio atypicus]
MRLLLMMICGVCFSLTAQAKSHTGLPDGAVGVLTVPQMTQGELLWLKGRVGTGKYITVDSSGRHCSIEVPVAVGGFMSSGIGLDSVDGLTIVVTSSSLNDAIVEGERINSEAWKFARSPAFAGGTVDAYILSGLSADEGFIINSKRRWLSWLSDSTPKSLCL